MNKPMKIRDCQPCADYWSKRSPVVIPEIVNGATEVGAEVAAVTMAYAIGVHERHLSGLSLAVK